MLTGDLKPSTINLKRTAEIACLQQVLHVGAEAAPGPEAPGLLVPAWSAGALFADRLDHPLDILVVGEELPEGAEIGQGIACHGGVVANQHPLDARKFSFVREPGQPVDVLADAECQFKLPYLLNQRSSNQQAVDVSVRFGADVRTRVATYKKPLAGLRHHVVAVIADPESKRTARAGTARPKRFNLKGSLFRIPGVIVIEKPEELASNLLQSAISRGTGAGVVLANEGWLDAGVTRFAGKGLQHIRCVICAAVVYDDHLKWDPQEYGGVEYIILPHNSVWMPEDIALVNT